MLFWTWNGKNQKVIFLVIHAFCYQYYEISYYAVQYCEISYPVSKYLPSVHVHPISLFSNIHLSGFHNQIQVTRRKCRQGNVLIVKNVQREGGGGVQKQGPLVTTYWTLQEIFGWPHLDLDHSKFSVLVCIPTIQPCYTKGLGRKPTNYSSLDILVHFLKCQHYILCLRLRNGGSTNLIWYAVWNMPYWHDYQQVIIVPV